MQCDKIIIKMGVFYIMEINIAQCVITVINFTIIISIVMVFIIGVKTVLNILKSNIRIEKKLDDVIDMIEKRKY